MTNRHGERCMISRRQVLAAIPGALAGLATFGRASKAESPLAMVYFNGFAPMSFLDESGQPTGILIEAMNLLGGKAGMSVKHAALAWERAQELVRRGEARL